MGMVIDIDKAATLRVRRQGAVVYLVLAVGALVANMYGCSGIGSGFIGGVIGYALQRTISITSQLRELELDTHEVLRDD